MYKFLFVFCLCLAAGSSMFAALAGDPNRKPITITVAAAASLRYSFEDALIPAFTKKYPWITVEGTYDSSGKLQTQIENGLGADLFMSAAMRQMNELTAKGVVDPASVVPLLENRIVLIRTAGAGARIDSFARVPAAAVVAIGDPDSVPAGQYAREVFTSLGIWDAVKVKASLGTNVTEVLNWVAEGGAEVGVVYATDAATTAKVTVVCEAPEGSLKQQVLYPVGLIAGSTHKLEATLFIDFLQTDEALAVFRKYGFSPIK